MAAADPYLMGNSRLRSMGTADGKFIRWISQIIFRGIFRSVFRENNAVAPVRRKNQKNGNQNK